MPCGQVYSAFFVAEHSTQTEILGANGFHDSDIDVFIYGLSPEAATQKLKLILDHFSSKMPLCKHDVLVSDHSVTLLGFYPFRHVQIVLRCYRSPAEILTGFDIDCCACGVHRGEV